MLAYASVYVIRFFMCWPMRQYMRHSCDRVLPFLASVDIRRKCPFDHLNGHLSLGNVRCLCELFFSFANVIRFPCVNVTDFVSHALAYAPVCGTRVIGPLRPFHTSATWSTHEKRMPFNDYKTNDVDKGEN